MYILNCDLNDIDDELLYILSFIKMSMFK